jgi:hypothetical protein
MEKFTKPELLNFLCEGADKETDDVLTSSDLGGGNSDNGLGI